MASRKQCKEKTLQRESIVLVNRATAMVSRSNYSNCMDLEGMVLWYFEEMDDYGKPYTVTGLQLFLGYTDTRLKRLCDKFEWAKVIIDWAKAYILDSYQNRLMTQNNVAGLIFILKNAYGWSDKKEVHETSDRTINIQWGQPISAIGEPIIEGKVLPLESIPTAHTIPENVTQPATQVMEGKENSPEKRE